LLSTSELAVALPPSSVISLPFPTPLALTKGHHKVTNLYIQCQQHESTKILRLLLCGKFYTSFLLHLQFSIVLNVKYTGLLT
jgi:hypothetical protein